MLAQLRGRKRVKLYKSTPQVFRAMKLFPNTSPHRRRGKVRDIEDGETDGDDALNLVFLHAHARRVTNGSGPRSASEPAWWRGM